MQPKIPYDIIRDFTPVGFIGNAPNVITVNPKVEARSMGELRDLARRAKPPLSYASPGVGTTGHVLGRCSRSSSVPRWSTSPTVARGPPSPMSWPDACRS
ncbi:tripartite tricarboxylate transporter substrate-binding protein [Pseudoroseomonas wenyumeiae]